MKIGPVWYCYNRRCQWQGSDGIYPHCPLCGGLTWSITALQTGSFIAYIQNDKLILCPRNCPSLQVDVYFSDIPDLVDFIAAEILNNHNPEQKFIDTARAFISSVKNKDKNSPPPEELPPLAQTADTTLDDREKISGSRIKILLKNTRLIKNIEKLEAFINAWRISD